MKSDASLEKNEINESAKSTFNIDPVDHQHTSDVSTMFDEVQLNVRGIDEQGNPEVTSAELTAALAAARTIKELEMAVGMRFGECAFEIRPDGTFLKIPQREDKLCIHDSLNRTSRWLTAAEEHSIRPSMATKSALAKVENEIGERDIKCLMSAVNLIALASRRTIEVGVNDTRMVLTVPHRSVLESLGRETETAVCNAPDDSQPVLAIRDVIELVSTTGQAFVVAMSPMFARLEQGCIVVLRSRRLQGFFRLIDGPHMEREDGTE